jgi:hypothetical protein
MEWQRTIGNADGVFPPQARERDLWGHSCWPLVGTAFGAGAVEVALDEVVVLNGYPGGPFT